MTVGRGVEACTLVRRVVCVSRINWGSLAAGAVGHGHGVGTGDDRRQLMVRALRDPLLDLFIVRGSF